MPESRFAWVTYEEAQKLIPLFKWAKEDGPTKPSKESAGRILKELQVVKNQSYKPFKGYQLLIEPRDWEFFQDMSSVGLSE